MLYQMMKPIRIALLLIVVVEFFFVSCSKDDDNSSYGIEQPQEPTYLQESELYGTWSVNGSNGLYFIYFTETGHYALCFNNKLMGAGTYTLEKNALTLTNGYLYKKDVLSVEKESNLLKLSGDMYSFKSNSKQTVNITASKSIIEVPTPKTGETFKITGLNANYGSTITYIKYLSDYMIDYQFCKDNSLKTLIKEEFWYYVYFDDMTYTQDCAGNGEVTIYKLKSHLTPLSTQIVKQQ